MGLADLLIPLLVLGVAGDPLTIYTPSSSSAVLGSAALLKCRFNIGGPINLTALQVHWYFSDQSMAQYDRGKEIFAPGVSISEQELRIGNASLGMENVQVSDEGQYKCVVIYGAEQQQSETTLRVFAAPQLSIPWRSARTDTATSFPCHVWGFYPQNVTVTWLRDGRVLTDATRSAPQRNPDGTFNLTLTYTFTPTASDSGSTVSCHVTHAALAQPLREEFPLAVTVPRAGADHTSATIGATLGILVAGGAAAALAIYCWRKRRARKGPPSAVETPPEAPAGRSDKTHGEDTVLMGTDGASDAREGSEQQLLLPAQGREQSETQEQDGAQGTAGSNSSGSKASDVGTGVSSCITQGAPETEGPSPNTEPLGEPGARDEERVGAASPQAQPAAEVAFPAQPSATGEEEGETDLSQHSREAMLPTSQPSTGDQGAPTSQPSTGDQGAPGSLAEAAANTVSDPAQEEDAQGEAGVPQAPVLGEISRPQVLAPGEQVTLSCQISGFYPKKLSVTWHRQGTGETEFRDNPDTHKIVTPDPTAASDGKSYSVTSQLHFTPMLPEDDGAEYRCSVEHETLQEPEGKSTGPLELRAQPEVSQIQVLPHWEPRDEVLFAIQIQNFYPGGIHRIQWSCDGKTWEKCEPTDYSQNPDLTFSATSVWRLPSQQITRPELRVRVSVQQNSRDTPIKREIRDTGLLRPPEVSEISQPESVTEGKEITLSCHMTRHFPGALSVTWLRKRKDTSFFLQDSAEYRIQPGAPHTQDGKSFQQETRLSFTPSVQRDQGAEYVCRVGHVALFNLPIEKRTRVLEVTEIKPSMGTTSDASEKGQAGDNTAAEDTSSDASAKEQAGDNAADKDTSSDVSAKGQAGDNAAAEDTSSDASAKERAGDNAAAEDTSSDVSAKGQAGENTAAEDTSRDVSAKERAGDNAAAEDTSSDVSAKGQAGDNAADEDTSSDVSAKERAGDNTADEDTSSDVSAKERVGDNAAAEDTSSDVSAKGQAGDNAADEDTSSDVSAKERAGDNTAAEDTSRDASAKERVGDNAAAEDTSSDVSAKGQAGENTAAEDTSSDASAKERAGDNAANKGATGNLAEDGPGSAAPGSNEKGDGCQHHPSD